MPVRSVRLTSRFSSRWTLALDLSGARLVARQIDAEHRALADLAVAEDEAAGLLDDAIDGREAEAGALAHLLGREERLPDLVEMLARNAGAGILHLAEHIFAGRHEAGIDGPRFLFGDIGGAHRQRAAIGHGVASH